MNIEEILSEYYKDVPRDQTLFLCSTRTPTTIAYFNVYEEGDIWVKIQGCDICPIESRKQCCGKCMLFSEHGCLLHLENNEKGNKKPFQCLSIPSPDKNLEFCHLEFKCISGNNKGKIRKVCDPRDIFE